jgi:hypothetical protein
MMNKKKIKKMIFLIFSIGIIAWTISSVLYGQSTLTNAPVTGITKPSGGSQAEPVSSKGVVLGSHSKQEVTQRVKQPTTESAAIGITFEGLDFDDNAAENGGNLFIPPDSMGAVGTDRVIAVVNTMIEARNKGGTFLFRDSLADFFAPLTPLTFTFDPKVIYDHYEDRFVVVTLERVDTGNNPNPGNKSRILLAVSKTGTPATATSADWDYHSINAETSIGGLDHWADYPGFEADEEAIYITANMFEHPGAGNLTFGVRLWIINKGVVGGFYDGGAAAVTVHDPYAVAGTATTTMPCRVFGNNGVGLGIGTFLVSYSNFTNGTDEFVQIVRVDDPLGTPTFTQEFINIGNIENVGGAFGFPDLPDAPQSGTGVLIEVNDSRALNCVWRNNAVWLTTTINPNSGPDTNQTTAHWFKLDTTAAPGGSITLDDQGNIGGEDIAAGTFTFFPSVAVNSIGSAKFGFSASAPTIFPGAFVAGREIGDPAGTIQASETVHAGEDFYIRIFASSGGVENRWGDYSGIALDPLNDSLFWIFNQYAALRGTTIDGEDGRWGTAWANSIFTSPGSAVDIYFLVDLSSSFTDDLPIFKAEAPGIISTLLTSFPDTQFGLGSFEDYPIPPFGSASDSDVAYRRNIDLTPITTDVEAVIAGLSTRNGRDLPQSQLPALFQAATGAGQDLTAEGFPGASIPSGQQANFRNGAIKLILLWTDAAFHQPGDSGDIPYPGPSFDDTVAAIMALDPPQVLGVVSGNEPNAITDVSAMAVATNALAPAGGVDCNDDGSIDIPEGSPLVCITPPTGAGIGKAIVNVVGAAIKAATPVAQCKDVTAPTDPGLCSAASVSINDGSFDPDGGPVELTQLPPGPYTLGNTVVTLKVTDETGLSGFCSATVTVKDMEAPTIEKVTANPNIIWPPNHKMVQVTVDVLASDNCDTEPACKIVSVSSSEPVDGLGDGDTSPDWKITGDFTVNLRAERSGTGNGRVYTITVECTDNYENSSTETVDVTVPHDKGKKK